MFRNHLECILFILFLFIYRGTAFYCKMSNEGCKEDQECCSKQCYRAHEGTNPRCTQTAMGQPCFEDYQCEGSMECGDLYECCAPYWGDCMTKANCCDRDHICIRVTGFVYKKCLYPTAGGAVALTSSELVMTIAMMIVAVIQPLLPS